MSAILDLIKDQGYKLDRFAVLKYDQSRPDVFPLPYLTKLYELTAQSGRHSPLGSLPDLFCGLSDLSHDWITAYLSTKNPLLILGEWVTPNEFTPWGYAFITTSIGHASAPKEKGIIAGYGFFSPFWGRPELELLSVLGLAYFFREFGLLAIHGSRYATNDRTARLMSRVGFHDDGLIPRWMLDQGKLVGMIPSTLLVEDFERVAEKFLNDWVEHNLREKEPHRT
jgi:RimJ/RimL family protein N-acetyltransferase